MSYIPEYPNGFYNGNFQSAARYASDNKECVRLLGLALLQNKLSELYVAKLLNVHPQTIFSWLQRYKLMHRVNLSWISGRMHHSKQNMIFE